MKPDYVDAWFEPPGFGSYKCVNRFFLFPALASIFGTFKGLWRDAAQLPGEAIDADYFEAHLGEFVRDDDLCRYIP
jgi:hypothetical protein